MEGLRTEEGGRGHRKNHGPTGWSHTSVLLKVPEIRLFGRVSLPILALRSDPGNRRNFPLPNRNTDH